MVTDALNEADNELQVKVVLDVFRVSLHLPSELFGQFLVGGIDFLVAALDRDRFVDVAV